MKKLYILIFAALLFLSFSNEALSQTDARVKYKGITIYIDYPDVPALVTRARLDSLINGMNYQEEGATRSFRKYWYEQSRRNVDFTHDIFFYTAPQPSTHYESLTWQQGILLWKDALEWITANNPGYDWRSLSIVDDSFDRSSKGGLASVMVISSKWGPQGIGGSHGPGWTLSNGLKVSTIYGSVLKSTWDPTPVNIFMTLHEGGHGIFGFPDTYDTDNGAAHSGGTGIYSLMSGGLPDVEPIGGPFLAQYKWGFVVEPESGTTTITLRADGDSVVVFRNPYDSGEYFTIEARKRSTIGNSLFPATLGLLIWHTDSKVFTSNRLSDMTPLKHYRNSIEQADGKFELEKSATNRGNIGDIYLPGKSFTNDSKPDTKWWDGRASGLELTDIQLVGTDQIRFTVTITEPAIRLPEISQTDWRLVSATPSQSGYQGFKAFDGNKNTYYHVPWGNTYARPHEMIIDLGQVYEINEFYYTANSNFVAPWEGRIADYTISLSGDGFNWGQPVASGTFFYTELTQYVLFAKTQGRYLKLSAINSWLGDGSLTDMRTSIAEINLRGSKLPSGIDGAEISALPFTVYPNPSTGIFTIKSGDSPMPQIYHLFDALGREIKKLEVRSEYTTLDISGYPAGMYYLKSGAKMAKQGTVLIKE
jgi:M6 family metalloprotease-like protein